ncbi:hypothetical protein [Candidatus Nitrospira salsa]
MKRADNEAKKSMLEEKYFQKFCKPKVFFSSQKVNMITYRVFVPFLLLSVLLASCGQPFIDIQISSGYTNAEGGAQAAIKPIPIDQFVRQTFFHGPPLDEMRAYAEDPNNVQLLSTLLQQEKCGRTAYDGPVCSNAVTTLGAIGSEDALAAIAGFLKEGETDDPKNKPDAVKALGIWINSSGDVKKDHILEALTIFVCEKTVGCLKSEEEYIKKSDKRKSIPINILQKKFKTLKEKLEEEKNELLKILKNQTEQNSNQKKFNVATLDDFRRSAVIALAFAGGPRRVEFWKDNIVDYIANLYEEYVEKPVFGTDRDSKISETLNDLASQGESDASFQAWLSEVVHAHERISKVGLDCYDEQGRHEISEKCKWQ